MKTRIKEFRARHDLTQAQLAEILSDILRKGIIP